MANNKIQYKLTSDNLDSDELEGFLDDFSAEFNEFVSIFLIFSMNLSYLDYLEFYYEVEDHIDSNDKYINLKVVGFHPDYLHGGVNEKAIHYSNRSPFPAIQLLRHDYIVKTTSQNLVESILRNNEETLIKTGVNKLQEIIDESKK